MLPVAMTTLREIFVPTWANDSRFVTDATGFEARSLSARDLHATQEVED